MNFYQNKGYRDAEILRDSVYTFDPQRVNMIYRARGGETVLLPRYYLYR
ncbi:hypothetical protein QWY93_18410 [Echinicola jeungdonensis]|nr:hypothetical protein [Echinicola jeungdonensis]MDN3671276.1 hypothetical protein [Echinicola jeungdonensis]